MADELFGWTQRDLEKLGEFIRDTHGKPRLHPPPQKRRRQRGGGRRPAATTTDGSTRYGRVVVGLIPAATNCRAAGWGIAEDAVSILDDTTGEEVDPEHPITVTNRTRQAYTIGCMVELRGSLVINGDCFPAPDEFWDEIEGS